MKEKKKRVLVVGAGISGATIARKLAEKDYEVDVYEKEIDIGGACADEYKHGTYKQYHGSHIFHTNNKEIWDFLSTFTAWHPYHHKVKAFIDGELIPVPFNLNSLDKLPALDTKIKQRIKQEIHDKDIFNYQFTFEDLEEFSGAFAYLGDIIYNLLFKVYSEKQWGTIPDKSVLSRVKALRLNKDDRYFTDAYQGIPAKGFTALLQNMLYHDNITVYNKQFVLEDSLAYEAVFYTGSLDELLNYGYGPLPYRTCKFEYTQVNHSHYQTSAVINYTKDYDFTRTHDYSWYLPSNEAVLATEYPMAFDRFNSEHVRYYPIKSKENYALYEKYVEHLKINCPNIVPAGRLGLYQYLDIDKAVESSLRIVQEFLE